MGPTERAPYVSKAKNQVAKGARKFTTQGIPLDIVEREEEEKRQFDIKMLEDIKHSVRLARTSIL